jgi:hypothetical protein
MNLFRKLGPIETEEHKAWARKHYVPLTDICGVWHPVVQKECAKINQEAGMEV